MDVFVITVPVPKGTYPSVNHVGGNGFRGGFKSHEYRTLGKSVLEAAQEEMNRVGWQTATYYVSGSITRYQTTRIHSDPSNLGKCEWDFLEKAGVVENDTLIRPTVKDIQYDPDGVDRIVIVLQRLYPRAADTIKPKDVRVPKVVATVNPLPPVTRAPKDRVAHVNGKPVSYGEALREAGLTADVTDKRKRRAA